MTLSFFGTVKLIFGLIVLVVWIAASRCDPLDCC